MAENKVLEIEIPRFVNAFLIPSLHSHIIVVYGGVLAAIICVPTACARSPRGTLGDLTALLLRCRCEATAFTRRSFRSPWDAEPRRALCACTKCAPWHGVLGDPTASSGDATAMPRRSLGALGDLTARTSAFWVFIARRAVAVRTPPWCDRGFTFDFCSHMPCIYCVWCQWRTIDSDSDLFPQ